eukprot:scaffold12672_cov112-Isochrysis_galbana.AAC.2
MARQYGAPLRACHARTLAARIRFMLGFLGGDDTAWATVRCSRRHCLCDHELTEGIAWTIGRSLALAMAD